MGQVRVENTGQVVAADVRKVSHWMDRARGLLGTARLSADAGLWIVPRSVPTRPKRLPAGAEPASPMRSVTSRQA